MESAKSFEDKLNRIYQLTQTEKDSVLAKILDIKAPSVAAAKKRRQIPTSWVEKLSEKYDVSADWIFFGRGPMKPDWLETDSTKNIIEVNSLQECPKCLQWQEECRQERAERRELGAENRQLHKDKESLMNEVMDLRAKVAALEARLMAREEGRTKDCMKTKVGEAS